MFWGVLIGTLCTLAGPLAPSFRVWYFSRIMGGLFLGPGNTVGLLLIEEMFFLHEHARKIGLWLSFYTCAPFFAPLLGEFMISSLGDWRTSLWLTFAICCLDCVLILTFMDETAYDRHRPAAEPMSRGSRLSRLIGRQQMSHRIGLLSLRASVRRLLSTLTQPVVAPVVIAQ